MTARGRARTGQGSVRIISGRWRGKRLPVPDLPGLRPTADRSRETLFNWLQGEVPGATCLDGFAGSGVLGFEALSRGATHVVFIESARVAARQLERLCRELDPGACQVHHAELGRWLAGNRPSGQPAFTLVFLDPPFDSNLVGETCTRLEQGDWLASEAWIYVETAAGDEPAPVPARWKLYRETRSREAAVRLYRRTPEALR